nr:unnamed protein product [Digitaria exilis]
MPLRPRRMLLVWLEEDWSELGFIVAEAREQLRMLVEWRVVQIKRDSNLVVDELAMFARRLKHDAIWVDEAPACVAHLLENNCTHTV